MGFKLKGVLSFLMPPLLVCGIAFILTAFEGEPEYAGEGPLSISRSEIIMSRTSLVVIFMIIYFFFCIIT